MRNAFRISSMTLAAALATSLALPMQVTRAEAPEAPAKEAARTDSLTVGDKAPAIEGLEWLKGDSVPQYVSGKVYVLEFWATWCGPCIHSMPHLSELQAQYADKGLTIIGVTSPDKRNTLEKTKAMIADKGDKMAYTVAWDPDGAITNAYMKAAGQNGIPCSFVIDQKGRVAYIGHPMELDNVLAQVVGGSWDIAKAASDRIENLKADTKFRAFYQALTKDRNYDDAYRLAAELLDGPSKNNAGHLSTLAWAIVDPKGGVEKKDLTIAFIAAVRADELTEHKDPGIMDTLARVYFLMGDATKAVEIERKALELAEESGDERMIRELRMSLVEFKRGAHAVESAD